MLLEGVLWMCAQLKTLVENSKTEETETPEETEKTEETAQAAAAAAAEPPEVPAPKQTAAAAQAPETHTLRPAPVPPCQQSPGTWCTMSCP